jgi:hypothetical protein
MRCDTSMPIFETIAGWLLRAYQASPRLMAVLAFVSGLLLFLPDRALVPFAAVPLVARYRPWLGVCFLFCAAMTISYPIHAGWKGMRGSIYRFRKDSKGKRRLHILDNHEKQVLASYLQRNKRTLNFDSNNGTVANFILLGILYHPVRMAPIDNFPTTMHEWVWEYLHEHPELVSID